MVNTIKNLIDRSGYTLPRAVVVHIVSGVVCGTAVAVILGVPPAVAIAVASGIVFLIA
jgi:hypothetical protein